MKQQDDGVQFFKEEVEEGVAVYSVYLKKVNYHSSLSDVVVDVGNSPGSAAGGATDDRKAHLQWRLEELRVIRAGTVARLVAAMTDERTGELDSNYVNVLLATYRTFTTTGDLLAAVISRYTAVGCDQHMQQQARETCQHSLRTMVGSWLETYREDFCEPPDYINLTSLIEFAVENSCGNDLAQKAQEQLSVFRRYHDSEQINSGLVDDLIRNFRLGILQTVKYPHSNSRLRLRLRPPLDLLNIEARIFAEQLTFIDAELFKRVVPHHCFGSVWSRRGDKKHPVQPVSVYATVDQFNALSFRVTATILKSPLMLPGERAEIVEKWIDIAQECRVLKNFSALKAIISALQSHAVYRLTKVWQCVLREKMALFNELAHIFDDSDNQKMSRELLNREGTAKCADPNSINTIRARQFGTRTLRRLANFEMPLMDDVQGTVPYLGTFLTDLTMIDTALKDRTKDGLINFDKRRKEFELMTQIKLLQLSAGNYHIEPEPDFFHWFYSIRTYDDVESTELSHAIEPADVSTNSERKTHKKTSSLGFFSPRQREPVTNAQFLRRDSMTSAMTVTNDDDDDKSIASMHELYASSARPAFRHSISLTSVKSLNFSEAPTSLTPFQTSDKIAVKIYLDLAENHTTNHYKSILISCNDHTLAVLRNTLLKYEMTCKLDDLVIVQLMPDNTELALPERGNVFYAIRKDVLDVQLVVRRRNDPGRSKHRRKFSKKRSQSLAKITF